MPELVIPVDYEGWVAAPLWTDDADVGGWGYGLSVTDLDAVDPANDLLELPPPTRGRVFLRELQRAGYVSPGDLVRIALGYAPAPGELDWLPRNSFWLVLRSDDDLLRLASPSPHSATLTVEWALSPLGEQALAEGRVTRKVRRYGPDGAVLSDADDPAGPLRRKRRQREALSPFSF